MPYTPKTHHTITHNRQNWRNALTDVAPYLPDNAHPDNVQALQLLPIFALVIVVDNESLATHNNLDVHTLMANWAKSENWIIRAIDNDAETVDFFATKEATPLANVSVFRYLLVPNQKQHITPEKRDAAIHIIDDQITAYLRRKLKPIPNYNYTVNEDGEVPDFSFGADKNRHYVDCHIISIAHMLRRHKLACFDMDSTLIKQEVITELAKIAGVGDKVANITESAMRGEIDFATSFAKRMRLLAGLDVKVINEIKPLLIPHTGAFTTIAALKAMGYHTALISGGFIPFAQHIADLLGIDEYHANHLDINNNHLTGDVIMPIIDGKQKAKIVAKIANHLCISLDETICIGDGANDLPMMAISDLGLAYHAKPIVQVKADVAINVTGLEGILYALGYPAIQTAK